MSAHRRVTIEMLSRQMVLRFDVPRLDFTAANDEKFQVFARKFARPNGRCSTDVESLIEEIQDEDRQRLLEPTSLPKVLRGRAPYRRPQTAIISYAAQRAYERRIAAEPIDPDTKQIIEEFVRERDRKIARIARKLRFQG